MTGHPDAQITALVDGELEHAARDRVLAHLAHCPHCRAEADRQRGLKGRLRDLGGPTPDGELTARLLAVPQRWAPVDRSRPVTPRSPARPAARRRRAPRMAAGGVAVALGLGAVLALGGPREAGPPVDPGSPVFVADFVTTTSELPLMDPVGGVVTTGQVR